MIRFLAVLLLTTAALLRGAGTTVASSGTTVVASSGTTTVAVAPVALALTFQAGTSSSTDTDIYTFSAMAIGAEAAREEVIAVFCWRDNATGTVVSSVTIGGVSATQIAANQGNDSTNSSGVAMYYAVVPTGTTADVVLTLNAAALRAACSVYTVVGVNSFTPADTATFGPSSGSGNIDLICDSPSGNSVAIGATLIAPGTATWSGVAVEDYDVNVESALTFTSAKASFSSAASQTMTCDPSSAATTVQNGLMVVIQ